MNLEIDIFVSVFFKVLVERWQSEECMAAIMEFFASKKKAKL